MGTLADIDVRKTAPVICSFTDTESIILVIVPGHNALEHHTVAIFLMVSRPVDIVCRRVFLFERLDWRKLRHVLIVGRFRPTVNQNASSQLYDGVLL